jgi:hypothetical protein
MMRVLYAGIACFASIMLALISHQINAHWAFRIVLYFLFVWPWILLFYQKGETP